MKKLRCKFRPDAEKTYTFLCDDDLAATLQPGERIFVNTIRGPQEVYVDSLTDEELNPNITYQSVIGKPE